MLDPEPNLPQPSAELAVLMALARAIADSLPPRKREPFLERVSEALGIQEGMYNVVRFRDASADRAVLDVTRQGAAWWAAVRGAISRLEKA
jgi:hypothetical protein